MTKTCNFCGNKNFTKKSVEYVYKQKGQYFFVNNVPCEECDYCGEQYFSATVLKKVEEEFNNIYVTGSKKVKEIKVPVEEYLELA